MIRPEVPLAKLSNPSSVHSSPDSRDQTYSTYGFTVSGTTCVVCRIRLFSRRARSLLAVKHRQIELAEPRGIAEDVDFGDLACADRERHYGEAFSIERADETCGAVDQHRKPCETWERKASRATSHVLGAADLNQSI